MNSPNEPVCLNELDFPECVKLLPQLIFAIYSVM